MKNWENILNHNGQELAKCDRCGKTSYIFANFDTETDTFGCSECGALYDNVGNYLDTDEAVERHINEWQAE